MNSTDIETPLSGDMILPPDTGELAEWAQLSDGAVTILGYDLAKDEDLDSLVGWEMIVSSGTFRPGIVRDKIQYAYVSLETMLAPVQNLRRINLARKTSELPPVHGLAEFPFLPGDHIVANDGSTGIYRQVVKYLVDAGSLILPVMPDSDDFRAGGEMGASSYDVPPSGWADFSAETAERTEDWSEYAIRFPVRIRCPRGIRRSVYDNPAGPGKSVTRYLG